MPRSEDLPPSLPDSLPAWRACRLSASLGDGRLRELTLIMGAGLPACLPGWLGRGACIVDRRQWENHEIGVGYQHKTVVRQAHASFDKVKVKDMTKGEGGGSAGGSSRRRPGGWSVMYGG